MRNVFFILIGLWIAVSTWAQNLPAVSKGVAALRSGKVMHELEKSVPRVLGNYRIGFALPTTKPYAPYLEERFFNFRLDPAVYPVQSSRDDARVLKALQRFADDAAMLDTNLPHILSQIQEEVFIGKIPYQNYLPQDIDVLYIGEVHDTPRVQKEIASLIKQLPAIYPGRKIYLAAEVIPTLVEWTVEENLIFTLDELAEHIDIAAPVKSIRPLTAALDVQIPLYGLEDELSLAMASMTSKNKWPTQEQVYAYATSLEGMDFRNKLFARKIRALQFFDPKALIVVYGGIDHMAYHNPSALPSQIKGKSFVVQITVPGALGVSNPLFAGLAPDEPLRHKFQSSPAAKLVESWKVPNNYNQLLGNDLTVIVHE